MRDLTLPYGIKPGSCVRMGGWARPGFSQSAQLRCGINIERNKFPERRFITGQYALVYMFAGEGEYTGHAGARHAFKAGAIFQRFPNQPHAVDYHTPSIRCYIAVPCQVFELLLLTGAVDVSEPVFDVGVDPKLVREFERMRARLDASNADTLTEVVLEMHAMILRLHRQRIKREVRSPLDRAMQMLSDDVRSELQLPQIARNLNMSYSSFRKQFLAKYGIPPREFRVRRRIERAMGLLRQPDTPMKNIAEMLGYSDVYAFCTQFKKIVGLAPGKFRQREVS